MQPKTSAHPQHETIFDIIVVGGGINGAGIAAEASQRGLKVAIYDAQDFAGATSSASSKLIHGGLRYLEHYEFRLVSEALAEREVLLKKAPHLVKPMRFRLPHEPHLRPTWMIRMGLFLYDHLGFRGKAPAIIKPHDAQADSTLEKSYRITLDPNVVKDTFKQGFEYSDCWVDDARLVILNILSAQEHGAETRNYCTVEKAYHKDGLWHVELFDQRTQTRSTRMSKTLVNATGPWVKSFLTQQTQLTSPYGVRMIKGSHIVVPQIHDEPYAYILQNSDHRIVFVIPYLEKYSLIGTTDVEYHGNPREASISEQEQDYLIEIVNQHFKHQIRREDIVYQYSGVRPLCDDESDSPQAITRDYTLALDESCPSILSIFGGKLTTYRKLAQAALEKLEPYLPNLEPEPKIPSTLPGSEHYDYSMLYHDLTQAYPFIASELIQRWLTSYGSRVSTTLLRNVSCTADLGSELIPGLFTKEVDYLLEFEHVYHVDDVLWRRTKLGIEANEEQVTIVDNYLRQKRNSEQGTVAETTSPLTEIIKE
ncbi:glycerol-3-phosphate dehydrogenase [Vibrio nitrifigilis]|uniref:Glycerol-3-phosphate dehydrogenase n=1 Tax=Vibrio nitrifigilis TaxID=2789781 RepID=A0ABS0GJB4_9VIBR|nr:glycerol-3-phosphate dehydrogenase [Vibrio nitrifigilis]MBF9002531.1 glycerol-3-phosphate dehydrogenase [Vibrio nitrifigilis]